MKYSSTETIERIVLKELFIHLMLFSDYNIQHIVWILTFSKLSELTQKCLKVMYVSNLIV